MPQDYFQFRNFRIEQSRAAMRVSTDACIQAALYAQFLKKQGLKAGDLVLDVGAGTGLLSLIIAEAIPTITIIALEPNQAAAADCQLNFGCSTYHKRLRLEAKTLQHYKSTDKARAIICNPPFFKNHLKSENADRSTARHDDELSKKDLIEGLVDHIAEGGTCCVMYPTSEWKEFLKLTEAAGLLLQQVLRIQPNSQKPINRKVGIFAQLPTSSIPEQTLIIRSINNQYTPEYQALLTPYFLDEYFTS